MSSATDSAARGTAVTDPHASIYDHGFVRVAAVTLPVALADPATNAQRHLEQLRELDDQQVGLAVFPELSLTGYSLEDLVMQEPLLDAAEQALATVVEASRDLMPLIVVGAPLRATDRSRVFNCAVTIHRGEILGIHPKQNLATYREFYERRWYAPGDDADGVSVRVLDGEHVLTPHSLITVPDVPGLKLFVEICEDMWVPVPPSAEAALAGATVIANLSGSPITVGRAEDRKLMARSASARCQAAYIYAAAGEGSPPRTSPGTGRPSCTSAVICWGVRTLPRGPARHDRGRGRGPDRRRASPPEHGRRQPPHPRRLAREVQRVGRHDPVRARALCGLR